VKPDWIPREAGNDLVPSVRHGFDLILVGTVLRPVRQFISVQCLQFFEQLPVALNQDQIINFRSVPAAAREPLAKVLFFQSASGQRINPRGHTCVPPGGHTMAEIQGGKPVRQLPSITTGMVGLVSNP
jgi:hypothetical protein